MNFVILVLFVDVPKCKLKKDTKVVRKGDRKVYSCPIVANPDPSNYR